MVKQPLQFGLPPNGILRSVEIILDRWVREQVCIAIFAGPHTRGSLEGNGDNNIAIEIIGLNDIKFMNEVLYTA